MFTYVMYECMHKYNHDKLFLHLSFYDYIYTYLNEWMLHRCRDACMDVAPRILPKRLTIKSIFGLNPLGYRLG